MEAVNIYAYNTGSGPISTTTADATGGFSLSTYVLQHPYGVLDLFAVGQNSGNIGAIPFTVVPGIMASPENGVLPGQSITLTALGFGNGE